MNNTGYLKYFTAVKLSFCFQTLLEFITLNNFKVKTVKPYDIKFLKKKIGLLLLWGTNIGNFYKTNPNSKNTEN